MKPRVYIETTIPSYLVARPNRDLIQSANQQATRMWWEQRDRFELFISKLVIRECEAGDPEAAAARLAVLEGITILEENVEASDLAGALIREIRLPARARTDAVHVAIAAVQGVDYFLTWNCRHIANLVFQPRIDSICRRLGYLPPFIGTPQQFFGLETFDV